METLGILYNGPQSSGQARIKEIEEWMKKHSEKPPRIVIPDWNKDLSERARSLLHVAVILAAGGSRAAHAMIHTRGHNRTPIIVFTTAAPYILGEGDPTITTGVCAHTSDHDGIRLGLLLDLLGAASPTVGVLRNSNRGDATDQWNQISAVAAPRNCTLVDGDINGPLTIKKAFALFQQRTADGVLVAADPFFYQPQNLQEIVEDANNGSYPAVYQWKEFVTAGGLMSYGPSYDDCYTRAKQMVADIRNGHPVPTVYSVPESQFELWVNQDTVTGLGITLPPAIRNRNPNIFP